MLGLKRLPCANTYHYVCAHLDVAALTAKVREWLAQFVPQQQAEELVQWAIDGKVLRSSHRYAPTAHSGQAVLKVDVLASGTLQHCQLIASKGYEATTALARSGKLTVPGW